MIETRYSIDAEACNPAFVSIGLPCRRDHLLGRALFSAANSPSDFERPRRFSSGVGAVLAVCGVAIGLGNIWRFPYMMGLYGGSAFLFVYLLVVLAFGTPGLMVEWALGRHTGHGPWMAFRAARVPLGRLWGTIVLVTVTMAASYYAVVIGWVLQEVAAFAVSAVTRSGVPSFERLTGSLGRQLVYLATTVITGCLILAFGVQKGIERLSRLLIPLFFALFAALIVRVLTLDGAIAGLRQFLRPEWQKFSAQTALAALGQAIFSLGMGGMFMVQYGSYMASDEDIPKSAVATTVADTTAAFLAGLIVVPAVLAFGLDIEGGPSLMFTVMPKVFDAMPAGAVFGLGFFLAVFIVAMLSLIAAYEILVVTIEETVGWTRTRALVLTATAEILLALPAYLVGNYIATSDFIWGSTMQPLGALLALVAGAWCVGRSRLLEQLRASSRLPIPVWLFYWIKFVLPLAILVILVAGWVERLG